MHLNLIRKVVSYMRGVFFMLKKKDYLRWSDLDGSGRVGTLNCRYLCRWDWGAGSNLYRLYLWTLDYRFHLYKFMNVVGYI